MTATALLLVGVSIGLVLGVLYLLLTEGRRAH